MDNFYVYVYLDQDNIPFYVGKGKNIRYNIIKHLYGSNQFLIRKIKKVGVKNVKIMFPLKNVDEADAFAYEELFIGIVGRRDLGLGPLCNLTDGGEGCSGAIGYWKGKHLSEETRQKMRDSHKGKSGSNKGRKFGPPSEEIKRKISEGNKGKARSEESKQKMSKAAIGRKHTNRTKRKLSRANKGRKHTEEAKQKIGEANKRRKYPKGEKHPLYGRKHAKETKQKISKSHKGEKNPMYGKPAWNRGKKMSKEARQKMSESAKRRKCSKGSENNE